jgi:long-chain acyl-CoA synthetase
VRPHLATLVEDYRRHGNQSAVVVHRGIRCQRFTYADLADFSGRFAAELMRRQLSAGERVVLWGENSAEWVAAFFGCVLRGVLVVPLDASGGLDFAQRVLAETQPRLVAGDRRLLSRLAGGLAEEVPRLAFDEFAMLPLPPSGAPLQEPSLSPDTPLQILFTSGTTAEPKGIVHTHRNVIASLEPIEREMQKYLRYERLVHPLRFLHTLPLSHVFGQFMGLWIPPLLAAEVHFESRLEAPRLLELIGRHRISVLAAVPRVLDLLRAELELRDPSLAQRLERSAGQTLGRRWWSFRAVHRQLGIKFWALVCGGAALPPRLERFWRDLGLAVIQGYGMTETAALITLNHPFHPAQGSIGKPLPGREIRIGGDGEVLVRGEMVSGARWQNGAMRTLSDPWLATGDLAEQGSEGELHFRGRKSETIVTAAGLNIHPEDVEAALVGQPGVEACAVVPLHTRAGAEPVAVLIFRGSTEQLSDAIDAANASLAEYQRIRRWELWPQLDFPRTSLGKIQRRKVAEWVAAQAEGAPRPHCVGEGGESQDPLAALVAEVAHVHPDRVGDDARLDRDFHLDSLARVQLQAELEQRLGVSIADEEFERIATLGELREHLAAASPRLPLHITAQTDEAASPQSGAMPQEAASEGAAPAGALPAAGAAQRAKREHARVSYPEWTWWPPVQALRVIFQELVMRPLVWLLAKPEVIRPSEFAAANEPLLLIANHVTAYDPPLILYALPWSMRRKVAIMMAAETLEDLRRGRNWGNWFLNLVAPLGYWAITVLFNVFPLPASAGYRRSFSHAGWAMDHGYHVLIFPEGRRSADGTLFPFRAGIGLLARESGAGILPIAMAGLGELKQRKHSWWRWSWFRSGILQLRVGEPVAPRPELGPEVLAEILRRSLDSLLKKMVSS